MMQDSANYSHPKVEFFLFAFKWFVTVDAFQNGNERNFNLSKLEPVYWSTYVSDKRKLH